MAKMRGYGCGHSGVSAGKVRGDNTVLFTVANLNTDLTNTVSNGNPPD